MTERHIVHTAVTEGDGRYTLPNLEIGQYKLEVSMGGFKTFVQNRIVLHVGGNRQVDLAMQIGEKAEQVEVVAGANLVQTEQSSVSQIISRKSILELPLRVPAPITCLTTATIPTHDQRQPAIPLAGRIAGIRR